MYFLVVMTIIVLAIASAYCERVTCQPIKKTIISYDCTSSVREEDLSAQNLYILWLKSHSGDYNKTLEINVPNYKIDDIIQAAGKGGEGIANTDININLQRPEFSYTAQKEGGVKRFSQKFDVNLLYDKIDGKNVHFDDEGQISERFKLLKQAIQKHQSVQFPKQ